MNIALEIKKIQNDLENLNDENLIKTIKELLNFAKKKIQILLLSHFLLRNTKKSGAI